MPQFDFLSFGPQLFWSTIFLFIYLFFISHGASGIGSIIKMRQKIQLIKSTTKDANIFSLYETILKKIVIKK